MHTNGQEDRLLVFDRSPNQTENCFSYWFVERQ